MIDWFTSLRDDDQAMVILAAACMLAAAIAVGSQFF